MKVYNFRKNTNIGNLDAETDSFLESCFYESEIYNTLINFNDDSEFVKRIIVGRTGSGKTALLKQIAKDIKIKGHGVIEAESTVFEHIKNNVFISELMERNIDLRVFYKSLWMHVLLVKVIDLVYPSAASFLDALNNHKESAKKKYNLKLAQEYAQEFRSNFFNDNIVTEISDKLQTDLSASFDIGLFKLSGKMGDDASEKIQTATARYVNSELLRKQKEIIKMIIEESNSERQIRIIISIDDLDKSWLSSSEIRYDFINALLDAFKELINIKSVKILISIRTDILMGIYNNNLRQEEKDRSLIVPITWNKQEIRAILDSRIDFLIKNQYSGRDHVAFADIFNFQVRGQRADDFILDRTMLRPRDAIDFVNFCLSEGDGSTSLNEDLVLLAEEKFYNSRKKAITKEWISLFKHIEEYIDCISFIKRKTFYISELSYELEKIQDYLINTDKGYDINHEKIAFDTSQLIKVWFVVGLIGIQKTQSLCVYSCFDKPSLDITDLDKEFVIHPLFFR
uniref:P-loop ATPase, Sll1717 family n=1 Tax=Cellvibrio fontiphilus TaxID=1815559 RepID=UPI002B4BC6EE|nr:P-loop NTPase fold protein [Cellvibrio fontiphilus]